MKYSKLFGKTVKTSSGDAQIVSHKLLLKAGFIRQSVAGRFYMLPLGTRIHNKVISIIREEMNNAGGQEMLSPILHPLSLWKETNRTSSVGFELMKIKDRREAEFALGGTAEEMFVDVVRNFKLSYRDLPFNVYQFSTKFRDELRASGGMLRAREFIMKDAYSFDKNEKEFKEEYRDMWQTYLKIFKRIGLDAKAVEADNGYIGGEYCHEFIVDSEIGESRYLESEDGKYIAHEDIAKFHKEAKNPDERLESLQEVEAERGVTMEDGVKLHNKPLWQQIKDVLFVDEKGRLILAIIRGDYEVNETKLKHISDSYELRHATDEEIIQKVQSVPGFISPVGIKELASKDVKLVIVADDSLRTVRNAYGGSNKKNRDLLNVNIDRDFKPDLEGDIAMAKEGYVTEENKSKLISKVGIEVGNIFQLGYHYTKLMKGATFVDKDGKEKMYYMGCYGIGIGRNIASIVEKHHDDKGIIWPTTVAPYQVHLISLDSGEIVNKKAEDLYNEFWKERIEVLWDDREDVTAGVKFADADLIGIPLRVVISKRSLSKDGVELKVRNEEDTNIYELDKIVDSVKQRIALMTKELQSNG